MGKIVFNGRWFDVEAYNPRLPNGRFIYFERVVRPDGIIVIPLISEKEVILLKEYRPAVRSWVYNFPVGGIDGNESPVGAAKRELFEETGFISGKMKKIGAFCVDPGYVTATVHVFLAEDLVKGRKKFDGREITKVAITRVEKLEARLAGARKNDGRSLAALAIFRATLWKCV